MDDILGKIGDISKDTKLNLKKVLTTDGAPDLTQNQIYGIALSSAYTTKDSALITAIESEAKSVLQPEEVTAAKTASSIMAMNNVYYRFTHLVGDDAFGKLPANLRMMGIANPGIAKVDFELYSLAISAINGCGMCMTAHVHEVRKAGISDTGIQSAIRIASVVNAASQALFLAA